MTPPADREPTLAEIVERLTRVVQAIHNEEVPELSDVLPALMRFTQVHAALPVARKQRFFEQLVVLHKGGMEPGEMAAALQERFDLSSSTFYRWREEAIENGLIPADSQHSGSEWEP